MGLAKGIKQITHLSYISSTSCSGHAFPTLQPRLKPPEEAVAEETEQLAPGTAGLVVFRLPSRSLGSPKGALGQCEAGIHRHSTRLFPIRAQRLPKASLKAESILPARSRPHGWKGGGLVAARVWPRGTLQTRKTLEAFVSLPWSFRVLGQAHGNGICIGHCCFPTHHQSLLWTLHLLFAFLKNSSSPKSSQDDKATESDPHHEPAGRSMARLEWEFPQWERQPASAAAAQGHPTSTTTRWLRTPDQQHRAQPGNPNACDSSLSEVCLREVPATGRRATDRAQIHPPRDGCTWHGATRPSVTAARGWLASY